MYVCGVRGEVYHIRLRCWEEIVIINTKICFACFLFLHSHLPSAPAMKKKEGRRLPGPTSLYLRWIEPRDMFDTAKAKGIREKKT